MPSPGRIEVGERHDTDPPSIAISARTPGRGASHDRPDPQGDELGLSLLHQTRPQPQPPSFTAQGVRAARGAAAIV